MDNYRSLPRIANSDLTELKCQILGQPYQLKSQAQEFGTRFHDFLLMNIQAVPTGKGATATRRMLDVIRDNSLFFRLLESGQLEQAQFWNDERTGLPCKARIDLRVTRN